MRTGMALVAALASCEANVTPWQAPADPSQLCIPNLDGVLEASELQLQPAAIARWAVAVGPGAATAAEVAGTIDAAGRRVWDFRAATGVNQDVAVIPAAGAWWQSEVPAATMALPFGSDGSMVGLYRADDAGLWLLGQASATPAPAAGRTLLRYSAPVPVLRYPLRPGAAWTATVAVQGELYGLPWQGSDAWQAVVDGQGRVEAPDFVAGPLLRVAHRVEVRSALGPTAVRRQWSWIFECAGEVARVVADDAGQPRERWVLRL